VGGLTSEENPNPFGELGFFFGLKDKTSKGLLGLEIPVRVEFFYGMWFAISNNGANDQFFNNSAHIGNFLLAQSLEACKPLATRPLLSHAHIHET